MDELRGTQRQRKAAERQFHNERFGGADDSRAGLSKWYTAVAAGARLQSETIKRLGAGADVLEVGCADGRLSLIDDRLAGAARSYHGVDISDRAIAKARALADSHGLGNCHFSVMDAEELAFSDNAFDLAYGRGIVHHLDVEKSLAAVARVLRPGGTAVFYEPMGRNPAINFYRRKTPHLRTADEHPLLARDIALAQSIFRRVDLHYFGLATLAAVPFQSTPIGARLMAFCSWADRLLLRYPPIREHAWHVLLILVK